MLLFLYSVHFRTQNEEPKRDCSEVRSAHSWRDLVSSHCSPRKQVKLPTFSIMIAVQVWAGTGKFVRVLNVVYVSLGEICVAYYFGTV